MSDIDEVPSSQPSKELQTKSKKTPRQKKRHRTKLSLNNKKSGSTKVYHDRSTTLSGSKSSGNENQFNGTPQINDNKLDIYAGLYDQNDTNAITTERDFDIYETAKLLELGNQCDSTPPARRVLSHVFDNSIGLTTVKNFMDLHQSRKDDDGKDGAVSASQQRNDDNQQNEIPTDDSFLRNEAKQVYDASFQFSEWPIPIEHDQSPAQNKQQINLERSNVSSVIEEILNDFHDDDFQTQEKIKRSPPLLLLRKQNNRAYKRTKQNNVKKLIFDDDQCYDEPIPPTPSDDDCDKNDIDIDLNSSRRIIENIANLSSFFTQSQTFELDFNACLSQKSIESNEPININNDADKVVEPVNDINEPNLLPIDSSVNERHLLYMEEDIFNDINSPQTELLKRAKKRQSSHIETPHTNRTSMNYSTPSTSKAAILNEQRDFLPKRLQFDQDDNVCDSTVILKSIAAVPLQNGFTTAAGKTFNTSAKTMKKYAAMFANAEAQHQERDLNKFNENRCDKQIGLKRICDSNRNAIAVDHNLTSNKEKESPLAVKLPQCNIAQNGFTTARGSNIKVSEKNLQRYAHVLYTELDENNVADCEPGTSSNAMKRSMQFNTPLDKGNCEAKLLATSTPHVNAQSPAITPINKSKLDSLTKRVAQEDFRAKESPIKTPAVNLPQCNNAQNGFTTARGSNIKFSEANLQRYAQVLYTELDENNVADCEPGTSSDALRSPMNYSTPLAKNNRQSKLLATSTPHVNAQSPPNYPAITPITKTKSDNLIERVTQKDSDHLHELNDENDDWFLDVTQHERIEMSFEPSSVFRLDTTLSEENVLNVADKIKIERKQAFSQQQAECLKKPLVVRRRLGTLYLNKLLHLKTPLNQIGPLKKHQPNELKQFGLPDSVINLTIDGATKFKFDMWNYYSVEVCRTNVKGIDMPDGMNLIMDENSRVGIRELSSALLQCTVVDPKLIPYNWISNCFKWIVVKLAAMDRAFAYRNEGTYLTPENVLMQLKYRYDREIDKAERSAIRKIVELDDSPAKRMVLFVSAIYKEADTPRAMQLCDGWYAIRTSSLDLTLVKAIQNKKIEIGTKLVVQGAELLGCVEGSHPLEMSSSVALKISANSTRRVKWHVKLGFCKESLPFLISLNSVSEHGGLISRLKAFVLRVYPLVYIIRETNGDNTKTSLRSSKMEKRHRRKEDHKRLEMAEKIYSQVNDEVQNEFENQRKAIVRPTRKLKDIDNGEDLWKLFETSHDAETFELDLSVTQKRLFNDYQTQMYDRKMAQVDARAKAKLEEWTNEKKSTSMLKIRLIDSEMPNTSKTAILNIWNVNEDAIDLRENTFVEIQKASAKNMRGRDILITANGLTSIREIHRRLETQHDNFRRTLTLLSEIDPQIFKPQFNEFDTIGYVFEMGEENPGHFQSVFIVDDQHHILCIKFWNGVSHYAYEDVVQIGRFLVVNHLDWRPHCRIRSSNIPQAFASEYTIFTECSKSKEAEIAMKNLRDRFDRLRVDEYIAECRSRLYKDVSIGTENVTTPLRPTNLNRSNLNRSQDIGHSPGVQIPVEERIARLNVYGNLPAPKNIYLGTRHNLRKQFKTPIRNGEALTDGGSTSGSSRINRKN